MAPETGCVRSAWTLTILREAKLPRPGAFFKRRSSPDHTVSDVVFLISSIRASKRLRVSEIRLTTRIRRVGNGEDASKCHFAREYVNDWSKISISRYPHAAGQARG